ncbi:transmembrane channel-like protein 7 [Macrobrachium rosenbergii]|uniref:transmembrane channel-like protein 7 n=1 Tax=Macrobrachium rosenbergii TaxID=79674 RepID=UPI0034D78DFE
MSRGFENEGFEMERFPTPGRYAETALPGQVESRDRRGHPPEGRDRRYGGADRREPRRSHGPPIRASDSSRHDSQREIRRRNSGSPEDDRLRRYKVYLGSNINDSQDLYQRGSSSRNREGSDDADDIEKRLQRFTKTDNSDKPSRERFYEPGYAERAEALERQRRGEPNRRERQHARYEEDKFDADTGDEYDRHSIFTPEQALRNPDVSDRESRGSSQPGWEALLEMLPSQMDRVTGTLRFRGQVNGDEQETSTGNGSFVPQDQPKSKAEVLEHLTKLREQPWPMNVRKERHHELKLQLEFLGAKWYSVDPVASAVKSGTNQIHSIVHTLDPLNSLLKRIEGRHGASVIAVFNFIQDMIRLNLFLAILGLCGIVIPSIFSVSQDTDQGFGWVNWNNTLDLCSGLVLAPNSSLQECNKNYTDKVRNDVEAHSHKWTALLQDFLQGTGFLEWTFLFSGYYPPAVAKGNYVISLAYLLTVFVTYIVSLVFVVRFVAKFLSKAFVSIHSNRTNFPEIVFAAWDYTIKEPAAAKTESALFLCEVKAALDDDNYNKRSLARTRRDEIILYSTRIVINLLIIALIGGSWAGIYFLVTIIPAAPQASPSDNIEVSLRNFFWEYAPTLTVAGLNLIFPIIFSILVAYEQYTGRKELFLTLGRCVLVRLTSLGILIITKISVIYERNQEGSCDVSDEFICWETHLGQQVYAILVLDMIIQIAMTFLVNVARMMLTFLQNPVCQKLGTIEFFVPGHVLDVVYIQAVCWVGLLYSPLLVPCCFVYFCFTFLCKLFTISVTCVPASRVFRASRSSAMFMTILALAFFMCVIPNALAMLYLQPSIACSPFRGLEYAWQVLIYYICGLTGSSYWIRSVLFYLDDTILCIALILLLFLIAVYYIAVINARGAYIKQLEDRLKDISKDKRFLMDKSTKVKRKVPQVDN